MNARISLDVQHHGQRDPDQGRGLPGAVLTQIIKEVPVSDSTFDWVNDTIFILIAIDGFPQDLAESQHCPAVMVYTLQPAM